jgi:hypothetical protein
MTERTYYEWVDYIVSSSLAVPDELVLDETTLDNVVPCQALTKDSGKCPNEGTNHVKVKCAYCDKEMWRFFCDPCLATIKRLSMFHHKCMYNGGVLYLIVE